MQNLYKRCTSQNLMYMEEFIELKKEPPKIVFEFLNTLLIKISFTYIKKTMRNVLCGPTVMQSL